MKKAYLIHGWGGNSQDPWFQWVKEELEKKKFHVEVFDMPNSEHPTIKEWVDYLKKNINEDEIDEQTYFIGHSVGCQTILRFLEKLHRHKRIGGCVFVAPWLDLINLEEEELEIAQPWISSKINFERVEDHDNKFLCIFSDNDPYVHMDEIKKFKEDLGAKIIIKHNQGHFDTESGISEIPEILEFVK